MTTKDVKEADQTTSRTKIREEFFNRVRDLKIFGRTVELSESRLFDYSKLGNVPVINITSGEEISTRFNENPAIYSRKLQILLVVYLKRSENVGDFKEIDLEEAHAVVERAIDGNKDFKEASSIDLIKTNADVSFKDDNYYARILFLYEASYEYQLDYEKITGRIESINTRWEIKDVD